VNDDGPTHATIERCFEMWSLHPGAPFPHEYDGVSLTVPAIRDDGTPVVLKIQPFPDREGEYEAAALIHWNGEGAIRLLAHDPDAHALLLERCEPGTPLSRLDPDDALDVVVALLPRLWTPASEPFRTLTEEAAWWAGYLEPYWIRAGRPFERELLDAALDALATLPGSQGDQVLVNQDLHADNILRAQREPWLVIDPKPLIGEREFGIAPLVRGDELGSGDDAARYRLDRLTAELGLDRDRARRWALAQTLAWGMDENETDPHHVAIARTLLHA
jgi:streptomycin 6-kinase